MNKDLSGKERVIAVVGPTAVGKTSLAIALAKRFDGEIISCDSMQIYRGMDIGTAKATLSEQREAPHHLIDIRNPDESFSCADYAELAREAIRDISSRKRLPILCGGTGLYLDSVLKMPAFAESAKDEDFRQRMEEYASERGAEALHALLADADPESALEIHPNNVKRVIRALEIYHTTGKRKSELDALSREQIPPYDSTVLFLTCKDKELLYSRIERRVDYMLDNGLLEECKRLYADGVFDSGSTASEAIGYKELLPYLKGESSLEECIKTLKLSTRHYAKRQLTWFKKHAEYHTIYIDGCDPLERALEIIGDING